MAIATISTPRINRLMNIHIWLTKIHCNKFLYKCDTYLEVNDLIEN